MHLQVVPCDIYCPLKGGDIGTQKYLEIKDLICCVNNVLLLLSKRNQSKPIFLHILRAEN